MSVGTAQPTLRVFVEKETDERIYMGVFHVLGEAKGVLDDLLVDLKWVFGIFSEGDKSGHELIEYDAE